LLERKEYDLYKKIYIINECYECIKENYEIKNIVKEKFEKEKYLKSLYDFAIFFKNIGESEYIIKKLRDLYEIEKDVKYLEYLYNLEENKKRKLEILKEIEKNQRENNCELKLLKIDLLYNIDKSEKEIEKIYDNIKYLCKYIYEENKKYLDYIIAEYYRVNKLTKKSDSIYLEIIKNYPEDNIIKNNYSYYKALENENLDFVEKLSYETIKKEKENYNYIDTYAWILYKKGKINKSKKYIKKAYNLMKKNNEYNEEIVEHYKEILGK